MLSELRGSRGLGYKGKYIGKKKKIINVYFEPHKLSNHHF